jgi:hypothetical protein
LSIGVPFPDDGPASSSSAFPGFVHPERYAAFSDLRDPQLLAISLLLPREVETSSGGSSSKIPWLLLYCHNPTYNRR